MDTNTVDQPKQNGTNSDPRFSSPLKTDNASSKDTQPVPTWKADIALILPLLTSTLLLAIVLTTGRIDTIYMLLSTVLTFALSLYIYPSDRRDPTASEAARFTRKSDIYRALVLATYGRIYGTPFHLSFFLMDFLYSYGIEMLIRPRAEGTSTQRWEILRVLPWMALTALGGQFFPFTRSTIGLVLGTVDRTLWRAAYLALVDDVLGILCWPNVRSWKGKGMLFFTQGLTVVSIVTVLHWMVVRRPEAGVTPMGTSAALKQGFATAQASSSVG